MAVTADFARQLERQLARSEERVAALELFVAHAIPELKLLANSDNYMETNFKPEDIAYAILRTARALLSSSKTN